MIRALVLFVLLLGAPVRAEAQMLLEDFTNAPQDRWDFFTDQVMGGVSQGRVTLEQDPAHLHMSGTVSTANNGGFIQTRLRLSGLPEDMNAFRLTAKGDGQTYYLHVRTGRTLLPWQFYQAAFTAPADWSDVTVPLSAFKPSGRMLPATLTPGSIRSVALAAYGRDHTADLRVSRIEAR